MSIDCASMAWSLDAIVDIIEMKVKKAEKIELTNNSESG